MRVKGATVQQALLALALLAGLCWNLAHAGELRGIELHAGATGTRAELRLDQEATFQLISLAAPDRLVVDLPGSRLGRDLQLPAPTGLVRAVRSGQPVPGTTRIVFDLAAPVVALKPHFETGSDGPRLVLEWPGDEGAPSAPATPVSPQVVSTGDAGEPPISTAASAAATDRLIASTAATDRLVASASAPRVVVPDAKLPASASAPPSMPPATAMGSPLLSAPTRTATIPAIVPAGPSPPPGALPARNTAVTLPSAATTTAPAQAPVKTMQDVARRAGLRPLVIAIDAGHGGQDPGAKGPAGSREKMITLAIARELARQVNATPGLKAYLTRDTDVFIPLVQRYQKARAAKADLFVSIHADSFSSPDAYGSSVFVLSQRGASSQAARWLASQENAADLVGGVKLQDKDDTLASVLLDLSQSATMKASEDMASQVLSGLKRLGPTHKGEIERANFVVLRSPDVPSMLVETAFISNPGEERKLNDPQHQQQLARAILDGVTAYFTRQPPPGTLYAASADGPGVGGSH